MEWSNKILQIFTHSLSLSHIYKKKKFILNSVVTLRDVLLTLHVLQDKNNHNVKIRYKNQDLLQQLASQFSILGISCQIRNPTCFFIQRFLLILTLTHLPHKSFARLLVHKPTKNQTQQKKNRTKNFEVLWFWFWFWSWSQEKIRIEKKKMNMMNALDSPLEALALDYINVGFLTIVNNLWTWVAVITAAVSFWRIRVATGGAVAATSSDECPSQPSPPMPS